MGRIKNFKIVIREPNKKPVTIESQFCEVEIYQRGDKLGEYSEERLRVLCCVTPIDIIQTRATYKNDYCETSHAILRETDPLGVKRDWLGKSDQEVEKGFRLDKARKSVRKGTNNV